MKRKVSNSTTRLAKSYPTCNLEIHTRSGFFTDEFRRSDHMPRRNVEIVSWTDSQVHKSGISGDRVISRAAARPSREQRIAQNLPCTHEETSRSTPRSPHRRR